MNLPESKNKDEENLLDRRLRVLFGRIVQEALVEIDLEQTWRLKLAEILVVILSKPLKESLPLFVTFCIFPDLTDYAWDEDEPFEVIRARHRLFDLVIEKLKGGGNDGNGEN